MEFTSKIKTDLLGTMKNEVERNKELKLEMEGLELKVDDILEKQIKPQIQLTLNASNEQLAKTKDDLVTKVKDAQNRLEEKTKEIIY